MVNQWNQLENEKIKILNGRCVINAIASKKRAITEEELLKCFISSTDDSHNLVQRELNRILAAGVENGFIEKSCNKYALPSPGSVYVTDYDDALGGGRRRYKM